VRLFGDAAAQALVSAAKNDDVAGLIEILGPSAESIVATREVADRKIRRDFVARADQKMKLVPTRGIQNAKTLLTGKDEWPLPIPIIEVNGLWYFDTAKGKREILTRRIGSNELDAIEVCRGYVEAESDYAERNRTAYGVSFYAQKMGQDVQQESTNEFDGVDGHELLATSVGGVSPTKCHRAILQTDQPAIGDGHAVRIAGEVLDDVFRAAKWPPRIDDPVQTAQLADEAVELGASLQPFEFAKQTQFPLAERGAQEGKKLAPEHAAEHVDRQEEPFPASNPTRLVG